MTYSGLSRSDPTDSSAAMISAVCVEDRPVQYQMSGSTLRLARALAAATAWRSPAAVS